MIILKDYDFDNQELKNVWQQFYDGNCCLYPYSSFDYNRIYNGVYKYKTSNWLAKSKNICYCSNGIVKVIMPLAIKKNVIRLFAENTSAGHIDFIYDSSVDRYDMDNVFLLLKECYKGFVLRLKNVNEKSLVAKYILDGCVCDFKVTKKQPCVNIVFYDDYSQYYKGLTKSVRQNLRTAYNKVNKENVELRLECKRGGEIDRSLIKQQLKIYNKRNSEQRRGKDKGFIGKFKQLYFDPLTLYSLEAKSTWSFSLYLNNELCGFMIGFETNFNSIVIPRLAIDSKFAKYSPGKLLINEAVKYLIDNSSIRNIDLSRGDEKYKYDMGGSTHWNYSFELLL